jgi:hypothetical protein
MSRQLPFAYESCAVVANVHAFGPVVNLGSAALRDGAGGLADETFAVVATAIAIHVEKRRRALMGY